MKGSLHRLISTQNCQRGVLLLRFADKLDEGCPFGAIGRSLVELSKHRIGRGKKLLAR
jgi:hypothetical protein